MSVDIQPITRTRGDTYPFTVTFVDSAGAVLDLTGASFVLTVNAEEDPTATQLPEFSLVGVVAAPLTGVVQFTMSESDADRFGLFYYDIQMTDVQGYVRTMMRGTFEMRQDITKNEYLWTAEGKTAIDGSDGIWLGLREEDETWEYSTRDGVPVLSVSYTTTGGRLIRPVEFPMLDFGRNFRLSCLQWMDESWYLSLWMEDVSSYYTACFISNAPDYRKIELYARGYDDESQRYVVYPMVSGPERSWVAGWVQWVYEWDVETGTLGARAWQPPTETDPEVFDIQIAGISLPPYETYLKKSFNFWLKPESEPTATAAVAWMKYEVLP